MTQHRPAHNDAVVIPSRVEDALSRDCTRIARSIGSMVDVLGDYLKHAKHRLAAVPNA